MVTMTTPSAYARDATAALHKVLQITPGDFDSDGAAAVIEKAIRHATREREGRSRRQLGEAKAAAEQRLARLLSSSPAVASKPAAISPRPSSATISARC